MKYKTILILLIPFMFACQSNDLSELDKNTQIIDESITVSKGNVYTYTIGTAIPTEGDIKISKQAAHFELSAITTDTMGIIYHYKPELDFLGSDNIEITQTYSSGGDIVGTTIIRISITVVSD